MHAAAQPLAGHGAKPAGDGDRPVGGNVDRLPFRQPDAGGAAQDRAHAVGSGAGVGAGSHHVGPGVVARGRLQGDQPEVVAQVVGGGLGRCPHREPQSVALHHGEGRLRRIQLVFVPGVAAAVGPGWVLVVAQVGGPVGGDEGQAAVSHHARVGIDPVKVVTHVLPKAGSEEQALGPRAVHVVDARQGALCQRVVPRCARVGKRHRRLGAGRRERERPRLLLRAPVEGDVAVGSHEPPGGLRDEAQRGLGRVGGSVAEQLHRASVHPQRQALVGEWVSPFGIGEEIGALVADRERAGVGPGRNLLVDQELGQLPGGRVVGEHGSGDVGVEPGVEQLEHGDDLDEVLVGVVPGVGQPEQGGAPKPVLPVVARVHEHRAVGGLAPSEVVRRCRRCVGKHARVVALELGLADEPTQPAQTGVGQRVVALAHARLQQAVAEHRLPVARARRRLVVMQVVGVGPVGELQPGPGSRHLPAQRPHGRSVGSTGSGSVGVRSGSATRRYPRRTTTVNDRGQGGPPLAGPGPS